jgi:hypothetical protein
MDEYRVVPGTVSRTGISFTPYKLPGAGRRFNQSKFALSFPQASTSKSHRPQFLHKSETF